MLFGVLALAYLAVLMPMLVKPQVTFQATTDYCSLTPFNVSCGQGEVIYILKALYGRMKLGNCTNQSFGHIGCHNDVTKIVEKMCSGTRHCHFQVPTPEMHQNNPCNQDLTSYLEVSHECVRVANAVGACNKTTQLYKTLEAGEGFFIGTIPDSPESPTIVDCGIHIRAQPGQTINLTIISFHNQNSDSGILSDSAQSQCVDVAYLTEGNRHENIELCPSVVRERIAYSSVTNEITLKAFNSAFSNNKENTFLWQYTAVGCPDLDIPPNLWVQRPDKSQLMVKCNQTEETWYLVCQNGSWKGKLGNCSQSRRLAIGNGKFDFEETTIPYGILITIVIGVALGVFLGGILLVVVFAFRRYHKPVRHRSHENHYEFHDKKPMEMDIGYAPVLDECGHFPVCAEPGYPGYSTTGGGTIQPRPGTDVAPSTGIPLPVDCIPQVPCVHHDFHIYETTRRVQQQQQQQQQAHSSAAEIQQQNEQNTHRNIPKKQIKPAQPPIAPTQRTKISKS